MDAGKTNNYLVTWIEQLQSKGRIAFSRGQVKDEFPDRSESAILHALSRLSKKGKVVSIYKGFYLIVPPEYYSRKVLPPILFIDYLMEYLVKPYYVGLLSAAALYGAAHQQPQEFFVITNAKQLTTHKEGLKINYFIKKDIPVQFLDNRKTESGFVKVSSPELTAFDLVYYSNRIGGMNRTCTILNELAESMNPEKLIQELIAQFSVATIQRLGYVLEIILNETVLADKLWKLSQDLRLKYFRQPLKAGSDSRGFETDPRWQIIINTEIDIDE